jgi:hypothetical protein
MKTNVDPLADRLRALENAMPGGELPPGAFSSHANKPRRSRRLGIVAGLVAVMLLSGAAGAAVHQVMTGVTGSSGVFSPGGPLACSPIQHMNPVDADEALAALGYDVTWQIEYRALDGEHHDHESTMSSTPPADGYVIEGVLEGRHLLLVVEIGPAALPVPGC